MSGDRCECIICKHHENNDCRFIDGRDGVVLTTPLGVHLRMCQGCRTATGCDLEDINAAVATIRRQQLIAAGQLDMFAKDTS